MYSILLDLIHFNLNFFKKGAISRHILFYVLKKDYIKFNLATSRRIFNLATSKKTKTWIKTDLTWSFWNYPLILISANLRKSNSQLMMDYSELRRHWPLRKTVRQKWSSSINNILNESCPSNSKAKNFRDLGEWVFSDFHPPFFPFLPSMSSIYWLPFAAILNGEFQRDLWWGLAHNKLLYWDLKKRRLAFMCKVYRIGLSLKVKVLCIVQYIGIVAFFC